MFSKKNCVNEKKWPGEIFCFVMSRCP